MPQQIHFVTGRLAEYSLREVLHDLANQAGFQYTVQVLPITVAALMTTEWVAARVDVPTEAQRVVLPGYCGGELAVVQHAASGKAVERGPRDLRRLPEFFGAPTPRDDYGAYDIEIIAEINHVPRLSLAAVLAEAKRLMAEGANVIDVGCDAGDAWSGVGEVVRALKTEGYRVSIDSLNPREIEPAVRAGAELVLSVNRTNREAAADWGCEVVVIPDAPRDLSSLDETVEYLAARGIRVRLDAVLEPIGFGFAASIARYVNVRERYPDAEMLMGIGNITELVDADSAAANVLLLGICQELGIRSVLTTEVVHWAQSSVRECDLARRLMHYALTHNTLAKHLEPRLIPLRGTQPVTHGAAALNRLAAEIKDNNYRIFAEEDR
jgi:dihydropteroate synthase